MRAQIFVSAVFLLVSSFTSLASATANAGNSEFSLESANSNHLFPRQACGSNPGPCNKNNCQGISKQDGSLGNDLGDCNKNGCAGTNSPGGGRGFCTAGDFKGCTCKSVCSNDSKACDANGCNGVNGFCTAGDFNGCPCGTSCGNLEIGGCDKNGCAGINSIKFPGGGVCTGNGLAGCPCTGTCGATPGPCNKNGCNGSNGRCTAGAFNGCTCK